MTKPTHWQEIDRIFAEALEREPAARAAFLDEACAGDEALRAEVESLLTKDIPETLIGARAVNVATRLLEKLPADFPENIGRYKISRTLGSGGMGRVYLGLDEQLNRPVAIKLLSNYDASEDERLRRFRQEALAASALNHPNILTIHEIGEFGETSFITTEFVDGMTLRARIKAGPLPLEVALDIAIQTASALSAAHAAGIIHRDIKPENVMIRADGLVKVLDFGIAKFTQGSDDPQDLMETAPGRIIGTAAYMSPEQARGGLIDTRSDIWSLGVILYEMVARRPPFWGDTPADVIAALLEREPAHLSTDGSPALESLERIIFKALKKERDNRYQTATELLTDLKRLRQTLELPGQEQHSASAESPVARGAVAVTEIKAKTSKALPVRTAEDRHTISTGKSLVVGTKRQKYVALVLVGIFLAALGLFGYRALSSNNNSQAIESIAVMPFTNESGNADLEYLSDGMTDLLINSLSQVPRLSVKARSSVFRYKGKEVEPQRIASELSVQAILSGRVVQRGNDLTLYLSLVDGRNGNQLWGEEYDRKVADLISLQREIARDVSQKLRMRLSAPDERRVTKDYTANAEAYQLYLKGRFHIFKLTLPEVQTGIQHLERAIQLDPNYALAHVGLSDGYRSLALGSELSPTEFLPRAKAAAQRAIEIDDALAEAHRALAVTTFWYDWDWNEAENQFRRSLELNPNIADTHLFYAHLLSNTGRHAEALAEVKRAGELDPYSPFLHALEGQFLLHAGKVDEALVKLRKTFELAPDFWFPHIFASSAYIEKGMFAEAIAEARLAGKLAPGQTYSLGLEGYALTKLGKREEARVALDELLRLSKERFVPPTRVAILYNGLDERDEALAWLERGFKQRDPKMAFLKVEPKLNNLRGDPRFADILRRAGF